MNERSRSGPLSGIRVLDFTAMVSGPGTTAILCDQGAEIIKIEPLEGDLIRTAARNQRGLSAPFVVLNRGKRSLAVNLKRKEGRDIVQAILPTVDVLVHNFRAGAMDRLGFSEHAVRESFPNLIYVTISGFGRRGPLAGQRVYDPLVQAMCGMAAIQRQTLENPPEIVRTIVPDTVMGYATAQAITAALFARANGKGGQSIDVSMLGVMTSFMWVSSMLNDTFVDWDYEGKRQPGMQNVVYATTDSYIVINVLSDHEWHGLCRALETEQWESKDMFATPAARQMHSLELRDAIAEVIKQNNSAYWLARLTGEDVPCAPVVSPAELFGNEQIRANEIIVEVNHPVVGRTHQPRHWAEFDKTPAAPNFNAPLMGAQSHEVLEGLGYSRGDIEGLVAGGVVGLPPI
jgi:crotonobetainyl-CoA:carnitine CoA-transferase CaiB-like acyl-CoA transferase